MRTGSFMATACWMMPPQPRDSSSGCGAKIMMRSSRGKSRTDWKRRRDRQVVLGHCAGPARHTAQRNEKLFGRYWTGTASGDNSAAANYQDDWGRSFSPPPFVARRRRCQYHFNSRPGRREHLWPPGPRTFGKRTIRIQNQECHEEQVPLTHDPGPARANKAGRANRSNGKHRRALKINVSRWVGVFVGVLAAAGVLLSAGSVSAQGSFPGPKFNEPGDILIADQFNNRVIEVTPAGNIVWSFGLGPNDFSARSIIGVNDAQRVGPLTLMAGTGTPAGVIPQAPDGVADNRVMLVDPFGRTVWQYGKFGQTGSGPNLLSSPVQSTFLPSTRVLITDQGNNRIIEVTIGKKIVWQYPGSNTNANDQLSGPNSAELLENGHILIADQGNNRAIEVTRDDRIVKTFTAGDTVSIVAFASRLENGDTLLTDSGNSRIVEVDANDNVAWQYLTNTDPQSIPSPLPTRAVRLHNGDTLISDQFNNRVIRVNMAKQIVASYGLPLAGGPANPFPFGNNVGFDKHTTQKGLYSPYDAKVVGDYTGLTPPFDFDHDGDN